MPRSLIFLLIFICGCGSLTKPALSGESAGEVKIIYAVPLFISPDRKALSLSYRYEFPGRATVHIDGVGLVPAMGSFKYVTDSPSLVFSDGPNGTVLSKVPLTATVGLAAKPPLNKIPAAEEFGSDYRAFQWSSKDPLQVRANAVLGKYVSYRPSEVDGVMAFATTFAPITAMVGNDRVPGRVAMLISFPYDKNTSGFTIRVQMLAQEGRQKSDEFKNTGNETIIKAAREFVDKVIAEIGL